MIIPRDYQLEACDKAEPLLRQRISTLVVMPTGTGKTTVIGELTRRFIAAPYFAQDKWRDVLVVAHTEELIDQLAERIKIMCPDTEVGIEMGERSCVGDSRFLFGGARVVVGSRQSLEKRLNGYTPDRFGMIVIDEAHHAPAATYRKILNYFPGAVPFGVTATPDRGDGKGLNSIFQECPFKMSVDDARNGGWLTPVLQQFCDVEGLDFSQAKLKNGDFDEAKLDRILAAEPRVAHEVAASAVQHCNGQTLVFCPGVEMAELVSQIINRYEGQSAEVVVGETHKQRRREIIAAYKRGDLKFLVGCAVFLEGFDAPETRYLFNSRPFGTRSLYAQFAGRVMRPLSGCIDGLHLPQERLNAIDSSAKPHGIIIDLTTASAEHDLVFSGDVLSGSYCSPEARKNAIAKAKKAGKPVDLTKLMEQEEREYRKQEAERKKRDWVRANANSTLLPISPGVHGGHSQTQTNVKMPTEKMRHFLTKHGYDSDGLSFAAAGKLIGQIKSSMQNGTATPKQQEVLRKNGLPAEVSKVVASVLLDLVFARRDAGVRGLDYTPTRDLWTIIEDGGGYRAAVKDPEIGTVILARNLQPFKTVGECRQHFADVFNTMPSIA